MIIPVFTEKIVLLTKTTLAFVRHSVYNNIINYLVVSV